MGGMAGSSTRQINIKLVKTAAVLLVPKGLTLVDDLHAGLRRQARGFGQCG